MINWDEYAKRAAYEQEVIEALVERGEISKQEAEDAYIGLTSDILMEVIDDCMNATYDDEDPLFAKAVLMTVHKRIEGRLVTYPERYVKKNRFTVKD